MPGIVFQKSLSNPVLGPRLGSYFDVSVLAEAGGYRMWFSWRAKNVLAHVSSTDGVSWSDPPTIVMERRSSWRLRLQDKLGLLRYRDRCREVSRPSVIYRSGVYHLWFCEHYHHVFISYATSKDGLRWKIVRRAVLTPDREWEKNAVMCPCVLYDEDEKLFKMWYSGGEQYEPDSIGYATSENGTVWRKHSHHPMFTPNPTLEWEKSRVTAMHVMRTAGAYYGFYIGFREGFEKSCIGVAKSLDGINDWRRYEGNPIVTPAAGDAWDDCNVYKPYVIRDGRRWLLWYNASRTTDRLEQIGLAICDD